MTKANSIDPPASTEPDLITRRALFFKLAGSAVDIATGGLALYGAAELLFRGIDIARQPSQFEHSRKLLDNILGGADRFQLNCGRQHILFPRGTIHPNILEAAGAWKDVFPIACVSSVPLPDCPDIDEGGDLLALGSPGSNDLSRRVFALEGPMDNLQRADRSPLRFDYVHAKSEVLPRYGSVSRYANGQLLTTPNWLIRDTSTGEEYAPRKDRDGFISSDYLIISKLPNSISPQARERASEILVIGGAHGTGLGNLKSILSNAELLQQIESDLRGCRYFQALFEMHGIQHDHSASETIPGNFKLVALADHQDGRSSSVHSHSEPSARCDNGAIKPGVDELHTPRMPSSGSHV